MPVREIPRNYRFLTGIVSQTGTAFEGTLERDFYILLGWDPRVARVEGQPVTLTYQDARGVTRPYTPDTLVYYHPEPGATVAPAPRLFEVKPRERIREDWPAIKRKYKAARRFARLQGWTFGFVTEKEIRTPLLDNIKFLRRHRKQPVDPAARDLLLRTLQEQGSSTPGAVLAAVSQDSNQRAVLISALWKLIATRVIACDLSKPLKMTSQISLPLD